MQRFLRSLVVLLCFSTQGYSQLGGLNTYEFLNLSTSARISGLGNNLITIRDDDVSLAAANPALTNQGMHQQMAFNHSFLAGGTQFGNVSYGHHLDKSNTTLHGGVQYVSYGEFDRTNELGELEGTFKASEFAITLGGAYQAAERLAFGANFKLVTSQLEGYNSLGLISDLAAMYFDTASNFTFTIVARNMGRQLTTYRDDNFEDLPFEVQVGLSKKLKYLPFRFSIIYHHFDRWNVLYDDPNVEESTLFLGDAPTERSSSSIWFDNFARHFIFNGEFLFGKKENFRLRVGYNHFRRKELSVDNFRSLAGFSAGIGLKINRFRIDYGYNSYHLGGGINHIGISTNIQEFKQ